MASSGEKRGNGRIIPARRELGRITLIDGQQVLRVGAWAVIARLTEQPEQSRNRIYEAFSKYTDGKLHVDPKRRPHPDVVRRNLASLIVPFTRAEAASIVAQPQEGRQPLRSLNPQIVTSHEDDYYRRPPYGWQKSYITQALTAASTYPELAIAIMLRDGCIDRAEGRQWPAVIAAQDVIEIYGRTIAAGGNDH